MVENVEFLGGEVVEDILQADLLVAKHVIRNSKVMMATVSGVRIVSKEYIINSARQSDWLNVSRISIL